jgi:hypothetical protein
MTWFRVDDGFWSHPKTLTLPAGAVALWVRAGSYCGKHLTDGYVPANMLGMLQGSDLDVDALVEAGLWRPCEGGWRFHDWEGYQDTREAVERRRSAWKARQRRRRADDGDEADDNVNEKIGAPITNTIPFLSKGTRDSRVTPPVSHAVSPPVTPTPPPIRQRLAELEALIAADDIALGARP